MEIDEKLTSPEGAPASKEEQLVVSTRDLIQSRLTEVRQADQPIEIAGMTIPPGEIDFGKIITADTTPEQREVIRAVLLERLESSELYLFRDDGDFQYLYKTAAGDFVDIEKGMSSFNTEAYTASEYATVRTASRRCMAMYLEKLREQGVKLTPEILERPEFQMIAADNPEVISTLHVGLARDTILGDAILEWGTNDAIYGYLKENGFVQYSEDKQAYMKDVFKFLRKRDPVRAKLVKEIMKSNNHTGDEMDQLREVFDLMFSVEGFKYALDGVCELTQGSKARKRSSGRKPLASLDGYEVASQHPEMFEQAIREGLRAKINEPPLRTEAEEGSTISLYKTKLKRVYLEKIEGPGGIEWNLIPARLYANKE